MKNSFYNLSLYNPQSEYNNCLFKCIDKIYHLNIDTKKIRKEFNIPSNEIIDIQTAYKIIEYLKFYYKKSNDITIIDFDEITVLQKDKFYIMHNNNHFYVIEKFEKIKSKNKKRFNDNGF